MSLENKYFAELARRLRAAGITAGHPEKNRLTVLLNNQPVLSVSAGSDVFLLPAGSNNMEASELYHRVAQTADEVYAYRCYPEDWTYERLGPDGMTAFIFWGHDRYGSYDTTFMFERYVELDERWLFDLAKDPEGRKPTVTWQSYNRSGVLYESYDEMFISLLPRKVENPELKRILQDYFHIRSQKKKVAKSITVYQDAAERFGD